jgi:hypothetical protein
VYYANRREVYSDRLKKYLPQNRTEAVGAARKFIDDMDRQTLAWPSLRMRFFNARWNLQSCQSVRDPSRNHADHWLVRFRASLRPGSKEDPVQVLDCRLDVRVGDRGSVIEFFTNWRPVTGTRRAKRYSVAVPAQVPGRGEQPQPQLIYLLPVGGSSYVAPYFLEASGRVFVPACEYSEPVRFLGGSGSDREVDSDSGSK